MSIGRYAARGAAIGGLAGAGLGYAAAPKKTEADKKNRKWHALRGGASGAVIGGYAGAAMGARREAKDWQYEFYHNSRHRQYRGGHGSGYARSAHRGPTDHRPHLHHFGMSGNEKTKAEALKKYREAAMKHHPDRPGGSESKMKEVNNAWENIKNSKWFEKLSCAGFAAGFRLSADY
jgi:hypothetical protein